MKKHMRIVAFAFALLVTVPVSAATIGSGETYTLRSDSRVADNLYAVGGSIVLSGEAAQDAVLAGGKLILSGPVGGDIHAAGGSVDVLGNTAGDVRVAGGDVVIAGNIGGDLVVFGGTVQVLEGSSIGGDVIVFGGVLSLDGTVSGAVRMKGGEAVVRGTIGSGTFSVDRLTLEGAVVRGDLSYASPEKASIDAATSIEGEVTFKERSAPTASVAKFAAVLGGIVFIGKLLATLLTSLFILFLFRTAAERYGRDSVEHFGKNTLWGIIVLIIVPVVSVLLLVTLVGAFLGVIGFVAYALSLLVAKAFTGIAAGAMLSRTLVKEVRVNAAWVILGVLFLNLIVLVPIVGWIIAFLIFLASLGVLSRSVAAHIETLRGGPNE